jgi:hypothetical protein
VNKYELILEKLQEAENVIAGLDYGTLNALKKEDVMEVYDRIDRLYCFFKDKVDFYREIKEAKWGGSDED